MTTSPALDAAVETLRLTQEAIPSRWSEDTADEILGLVQLTFHDYIVAVLADPMPAGRPDEGRPTLAMRAALHGRAVAGLLTTFALAQWQETGATAPEGTLSKAPARLTEHWIDQITAAARAEDGPAHETAVDYVRGVAIALSFAARVLGARVSRVGSCRATRTLHAMSSKGVRGSRARRAMSHPSLESSSYFSAAA
jgi:hypothetical protein